MSANKNFSNNLKSFSSNNNPTITNLVIQDPKFPPPPSPSQFHTNLENKYLKSPSKTLIQITKNLHQMNLVNLDVLENSNSNQEFKAEMENLEGIMKELKKQKNFNI